MVLKGSYRIDGRSRLSFNPIEDRIPKIIWRKWLIFMHFSIIMKKGQVAKKGGDFAIAGKTKLRFHFHNPNSVEETANYIAKIFVEVNQAKVERILQEKANRIETESEKNRSLST